MDKIKVADLVNACNNLATERMVDDLLKNKVQIRNYIGYGEKCYIAQNIIKTSSKKDGFVNIDSCKRYILSVYALIDTYTNISIDKSNITYDYDLLESNGLIEKILRMIPDKEKKTFDVILKMKQDDFITNEYEMHGYISNIIKNLYPMISKNISPLLDSLTELVGSIDEDKLEKILKKIQK